VHWGFYVTERLTHRLNQILPRLASDDFLKGRGLGNELAFYVFDYPPEGELTIRQHIRFLVTQLPKKRPGLCVRHVNLFELTVDYLERRNLLQKGFEMQLRKGDDAFLKALAAPLHASKLAPIFREAAQPDESDLVLVSGVGNAWPLLRTHSLLANLHPLMGGTPLVLFFPGRYDGHVLQLFGRLKDSHYYRAFSLVP